MGVPALFRWLSTKYPKIITPVVEEQPREVDGQEIPVDTRGPNPNGEEQDNLYLDMNGIVHPCSHPEDKPAPANEEEMMLEIFKFTDRVVNMVRPRKVLMLAVDGVAPRAKMNQQRSRRFRSAQEAKEKDAEKEEFMKKLRSSQADSNGNATLPEVVQEIKKTWDSNSITPGTPFMDLLADALRYWTAYKLNTDPAWAKLKVIISDATVPGEGEHKIMEFVRAQRNSPEHDPNTRHVICGLDADLIMLGLATHEPYFRVLREDVFAQERKMRFCRICGQKGHNSHECQGKAKEKEGDFDEKQHAEPLKPWIWFNVPIFREYLAEELNVPNQGFRFDLERAIDDWVFMCFFVGNDFLPHLPSLEIRENAIDTLIAIWRDNLPAMGGYMTKDGDVDFRRAQFILDGLAKQEDAIFKRRQENEKQFQEKQRRREQQQQRRGGYRGQHNSHQNGNSQDNDNAPTRAPKRSRGEPIPDINALPTFDPSKGGTRAVMDLTHDAIVNRRSNFNANEANKSAAAVLKERLQGKGSSNTDESPATATEEDTSVELGKRKRDEEGIDTANGADQNEPTKPDEPEDTVRLWEEGYQDRYYEQKFDVGPNDIEFRQEVARKYAEGLAWVLRYYFQGCPSWTWYYPYHFAPFASDFKNLEKIQLKFERGKAFRPFEQLMGVMPAASNHTIPPVFRPLMTDEDSDILEFYPETFRIDMNGKKMAWQGVAILPFIDEKRLLAAMDTKYPLLTDAERARNETGTDALYFSSQHPLYQDLATNVYGKGNSGDGKFTLVQRISEGLAGEVEKLDTYLPDSYTPFPFESKGMPDLESDSSMVVHYSLPESKHIHKSMLLRGVRLPPPVLDANDRAETRSRASHTGRRHGGVGLHNNGNRGGRINYGPGDRNGGRHSNYNNYNNNNGGYNDRGNNHNHWQGPNQHGGMPPFPPNTNMPYPPPPPGFFQQNGMPIPPPGFPPPPPHNGGQYGAPRHYDNNSQGYNNNAAFNNGGAYSGYEQRRGGGRSWRR